MRWWQHWQLAAAAGLGAVAVVTLVVILVLPRRRTVPLHRLVREPGQRTTALSVTADRLTGGVERLAAGRLDGLAERLDVAGIRTPPSHLVVTTASGMVVASAVVVLLGMPWLVLAVLVLGPLGVWAWIAMVTDRRRSAFSGQLDETAQMLAGSLRSGYSFGQALATVGREAPSPTSDEFTRITNEVRLGRPMADSMERTAQRMRSEDFAWLGQAVAINRQVGGNLADVLDGVSRTLRERAQLRRQVASLSAEGRLSAIVLIALPFVLIGVFGLINPGYIGLLFTRLLGWLLLALAAILLAVGALWLRAVVRIKY